MAERIVLCAGCGQKNRIGIGKGPPRCGSCKKPLAIDSYDPDRNFTRPLKWMAAAAILGAVIYVSTSGEPRRPLVTQGPPTPKSTAITVKPFDADPIAITTGVIVFPVGEAIAPIKIKTAHGANYLVRVVDAFTSLRVMEIFIEGGDTYEGEIPLGSYKIKYASGDAWYGPELLFGPATAYSKTDKIFSFVKTAGSITGYTIELIRQTGGNLRTSSIKAKDF